MAAGDYDRESRELHAIELCHHILISGRVERDNRERERVKPGFHSNAIACVACVNCVNENRKQPIMVITASTEHSDWLALAFVA